MTVIGRRITEHDRKWVDLQHADLTSADLSYAVLTKPQSTARTGVIVSEVLVGSYVIL
jgi:uncharacterized protein YjbI with pentapeptide repeats